MIIPAQGLRIVLAVRPVDFRCGHDALAGLVQNSLGLDPHSGLIVVFRSKRADRLKIEPPQVCRRPQPLRGWGYGQQSIEQEVFS